MLFSLNSVPNSLEQDREFEKALKSIGAPSRPKPDFVYGYTNTAFDEMQMKRLMLLGDSYCVSGNREPWFPYFLVEWKTSAYGGSFEDAETQVRCSGAAAVQSLHNLYESRAQAAPLAARSAVFGMCVDSKALEIFVHWQHEEEQNGDVAYETDRIDEFFLRKHEDIFHARSIILNILDWAQHDRLEALRSLMSSTLAEPESNSESTAAQELVNNDTRITRSPSAPSTTAPSTSAPQLTPPASDPARSPPPKRRRYDTVIE